MSVQFHLRVKPAARILNLTSRRRVGVTNTNSVKVYFGKLLLFTEVSLLRLPHAVVSIAAVDVARNRRLF